MTPSALACVPTLITDEMNAALCANTDCNFEESEVTMALHQMAPLKAPGPDGMSPLFYQHFWGTINTDVIFFHFDVVEFKYLTSTLKSYLYNSYPKGQFS